MPRFLHPLLAGCFAALLAAPLPGQANVNVTVDPNADRTRISPYVYGTNARLPGLAAPLRRQGGNRMTGYNWENNASNAGHDWYHQSDDYLTWVVGITGAEANTPGRVLTHFHDQALADGTRYSVVTLPMAGYVAADKIGRPLTASEAAPSPRWVAVENDKPTALSLSPDLHDGRVYNDELIDFLRARYGGAAAPRGIKAYGLDNEPDLWSDGRTANGLVALDGNGTHPLIHPAKPRAAELITRTVALAQTIKRMDPAAEVIGFSSYGMTGYETFQSAPDWAAERTRGNYRWFLDYFLDQMRQASTTAGQRLLDVVNLHNYSEATGGGHRINASDYSDYANIAWNEARMQAPRTWWDSTYREQSWIGQYRTAFLPLLTNFRQSIDTFYPGTKLAVLEYNFGGQAHVSGGIAQADALGILGEQGVYLASFWPFDGGTNYTVAAFQLYLDYDGAGSRFGDTAVHATWDDRALASVHSAAESGDPTRLHLIVLNKSASESTTFDFLIAGATTFRRARVFAFDAASATITERAAVGEIAGNRFTYALPALTAAHLVLDATPVRADPLARRVSTGENTSFHAAANHATAFQWSHNGAIVPGATTATLSLSNVQLSDTGLYLATATDAPGAPASAAALLGLESSVKVTGSGREVLSDIFVGLSGNTYDQVLLEGAAAAITADRDADQITRISFIDLDDDIVQVEFSGAGTLSLVLDEATGPAEPTHYQQELAYARGHAGIVITGADETSNVSVFTVGRFTAHDPTGQFDRSKPIGPSNDPANNGSPLFVGHEQTDYDGIADLAFIAIGTRNGRFGGVRTANATYFARRGYTGVYAPGVEFSGPLFVGDITAFDEAEPVIVTGSVADARITGGDLFQENQRAVQVSGIARLAFTDGSDSHGVLLPAQANRARLVERGTDVTAQIVADPAP